MSLDVETDKDRVVLAFPGKSREWAFDLDEARELADWLDKAATFADAWIVAGGRLAMDPLNPVPCRLEVRAGRLWLQFQRAVSVLRPDAAGARRLAAAIRNTLPQPRLKLHPAI
jgi:hypothetical protein